jgi:YVTN family beta-propeller protein
MNRRAKWIGAVAVCGAMWASGCRDTSSISIESREPLITGKAISPTTLPTQNIGSLPMNMILTPNGKFAITSDMGLYESMWVIRTSDGKGASQVEFSNAAPGKTLAPAGEASKETTDPGSYKTNGLYYGLAMTKDASTIYAAQGGHDSIAVMSLDANGKLSRTGTIRTKHEDFPAGLALDDRGRLYVSNNAAGEDNPYKLTGSVAIYDPATKSELGRFTFSDSHQGTSNFPLGIAVLGDGSKTYVAAERDDAVYILNTRDATKPTLAKMLPTGAHPVALLLSRDQSRLYVANSLSDTISVIDTKSDQIVSTVLLRPRAARDLPGVSPVALALSPDEKTLYAAVGDMNAVAVIDTADSELLGYIPTGWYPSSVAVAHDGRSLLVTNAKGTSVRNPNNMPDPQVPRSKKKAALAVLEGNVLRISIPRGKDLQAATDDVLKDNRIDVLEHPAKNPLAGIGLAAGKIKHVIYIIKENRTYDQVLGDLPQGNGDKSLVLFGRNITPNQHALAERFVLLDNLYACGEVSGDGWDWSTQGMADAYVVRNIPYNYSHRGRKFDEEGQNNAYPTGGAPGVDQNGKPWTNPAFRRENKPVPDVANTGRNIWDAARDAHITFRNYGFFMSFDDRSAGLVGAPDNLPCAVGLQPGGHDLSGITDLDFRRFDQDYADSEASEFYFKQTADKRCLWPLAHYGKDKLPSRFTEWNREFQLMLKKDATGGSVPNLMLVRMPTDHTVSARSGAHTPSSYLADNDYGVGQIVDAVSRSAIWKDTAIFIIEDDAQSGVDHVDSHRTTAYVISPWIKQNSVDHHFYNTDSVLKTIELLLGLHPLSQYDAIADPIMDWDTSPTNAAPFTAVMPPNELIAAHNPTADPLSRTDPRWEMAKASDAMDFTHADAAPARQADEIVWHTIKGANSKMPQWRGAALGKPDDDD